MRVVIQRVLEASVKVNNEVVGNIDNGLLVFAGYEEDDNDEDIDWIVRKIMGLRIFNDDQQIMNLSIVDTGGNMLVISQFTLHASTKKGNRPSYIKAAKPQSALIKYESTLALLSEALGKKVERGIFGADMKVSLINDGPVTILMDSKNKE
jgi:D-tyrosyl-tRNA(Tyr) deacylase